MPKKEERGSKDELEVLKIILDENPYLKSRVLENLKQLKTEYELRTGKTKEKDG